MSDELKRLIKKRGSLRASLTIFSNALNALNSDITDTDANRLQKRLERVLPLLDEFLILQSSIEELADDSEEQYKLRGDFEDTYFDVITIAETIIKTHTKDNATPSNNAKALSSLESVESHAATSGRNILNNSNNINTRDDNIQNIASDSQTSNNNITNNNNTATYNSTQDIALPPIVLQKFDGTYDSWLSFRDTYKSLIHDNNKLSDMKKYHYLRGSLEGTAAQVIKAVEFTEMGYSSAWSTLCERYDREKNLIYNHVKSLFNVSQIYKETSNNIRALVDSVAGHLQALEKLGRSTSNWDLLLIHMITNKLSNQANREWEKYSKNIERESWTDLKHFLQDRADLLERTETKAEDRFDTNRSNSKQHAKFKDKGNMRSFVSTNYTCSFCSKEHSIYKCTDFLQLPIDDRIAFVNNSRLCQNCLRDGHHVKQCRLGPCKSCKGWHNSLLHKTHSVSKGNVASRSESVTLTSHIYKNVILSTAKLFVHDKVGKLHIVRALLDCGSQTSFITEQICNKLGVNTQEVQLSISGIASSLSTVNKRCNIKISSLNKLFNSSITCFVLKQITTSLPSVDINLETMKIPNDIHLSDSQFYKSGPIDILIGADLFWQLLCPERVELHKNGPVLQKTQLGWVIAGQLGTSSKVNNVTCNLSVTNTELHKLIEKFWKIEDCVTAKHLSEEEKLCEETFLKTTWRDESGRFVTSFPLKQSPDVLGESRTQAIRQFLSLEKRLAKNPNLNKRYVDFMREYQQLGHMTLLEKNDADSLEYFMPHHGVLREDHASTKLRVVFNCSSPSTSGLSLNDIQCVGPVLQDDLFSIILRFRKYNYVFSADIEKMYRMILIEPKQRCLQRIVWRENSRDPIQYYQLNTVTYGQAAASYLSIKCLHELAANCQNHNPKISRIIRQDFYVDDLLSGADTISEAISMCTQISDILKTGCFKLRKWISNNQQILQPFDKSDNDLNILAFAQDENAKTLGLTWSYQFDQLLYNTEVKGGTKYTKRKLLSSIAKIFDPLGLLAPCIISAKILMQRLWSEQVPWDDPLPNDIAAYWEKFATDLPRINEITIPRQAVCFNQITVDIHCFSDASEKAYGTCIYLVSKDKYQNTTSRLLCAKSKVAPLKSLSIPRLELCAAQLAARLYVKVNESMNIPFHSRYIWSDSSIVLAWVNTSPHLLKTFVANRISDIQTLASECEWRHVPTHDNPADILSRGIYPSELTDCDLWWSGPAWLQADPSQWPTLKQSDPTDLSEFKPLVSVATSTAIGAFPFDRFSKLSRLKRTAAYILRFKNNCMLPYESRVFGPLSLEEIETAFTRIIKAAQRESFASEFSSLRKDGIVKSTSKILSARPFLNHSGLIRVGGRLENSEFSFDKKHPIILDGKHKITRLLFEHEHIRLLHVGAQQLLSVLRESFWPTGGKNLAKKTVHNCLVCFRHNPKTIHPIMGNLPRDRVVPSSPFTVTGVDYAGPFLLKDRPGRGYKTIKSYVSVFVCFATKAIHLELVSSLSTDHFILALRRFVSRRGKPSKIFSDNGTNFVGANRELHNFLKNNQDSLSQSLINENIKWQFIPPSSPHFGGLWEASVKSCKYHLKRVIGSQKVTFEEFTTILCQIEAIVNSRPISSISSDPSDLSPLTPAHFLVGRTLTSAPDDNLVDVKVNRLTRYQLIQQMCQHFWRRWSLEYVSQLQQRIRWKTNQGQLRIGDLALIKEDNTLPTEWLLGRILELKPGSDGISRVAILKTRKGLIKRTFAKICPLPTS